LIALTVFVDGASKGNPGHAGIGIRIEAEEKLLVEHCEYIGQATNNIAEYQALLKGLEIANQLNADQVKIISDSELVVRQMNGEYKVKNQTLLPLYQKAQTHSRQFDTFKIVHVPRTKNKEADRLANLGIAQKDQNPE
jgi:ribonuclease HI